MSQVAQNPATFRRAAEILQRHQQALFRGTDRLFGWLLLFQWLAGIATALWLSPYAWAGTQSATHVHVWAATVLGGAIVILPILLAWRRPGATSTRYLVAVDQMAWG